MRRNPGARGVDIWAEWADQEHTSGLAAKPANLGPVYGYLCVLFGEFIRKKRTISLQI